MKTIDFHTHIFPPEIIKARDFIIKSEPDFSLLYSQAKSRLASAEDLIDSMDANGIDISVAVGFPWNSSLFFMQHNDYLLEAQSKYPDRIKAFVCFDLSSPDAFYEAERCVSAGASGIGELAFYRGKSSDSAPENFQQIMNLCRNANLPVLVHVNEPVGHVYPGKGNFTPEPAYNLVRFFPENRIILAHWGGGLFFYNLMKRDVSNVLKNVYVDTAASPFLYKAEVYETACRIFGSDKILLGSDFPLISPSVYFREMAESGMSDKEIQKIRYENAAQLLGL